MLPVDFDQDSLTDLLIGYTAPIRAELWHNTGNFSFAKVTTLSPQTMACSGEWDYLYALAGNFYGTGKTDLWFYALPDSQSSL